MLKSKVLASLGSGVTIVAEAITKNALTCGVANAVAMTSNLAGLKRSQADQDQIDNASTTARSLN
jgi:hypothetical protein